MYSGLDNLSKRSSKQVYEPIKISAKELPVDVYAETRPSRPRPISSQITDTRDISILRNKHISNLFNPGRYCLSHQLTQAT